MKVPKMYKSSDRYNAGTDVIYDDDSKLQYAPFVYAGVTAKDNGDGGGDDEEGEDVMVVNVIWNDELSSYELDKNWSEIKTEVAAGKLVMLKELPNDNAFRMSYLADLSSEEVSGGGMIYNIVALSVDNNASPVAVKYTSDSETGTMVEVSGD